MKKITITILATMMMITFSFGTAMAKFGNSGNGGLNAKFENAVQNGNNWQKMGLAYRMRQPMLHRFLHCVNKLDLSVEKTEIIKGLLEDYREAQITQNESMKNAMIDYWMLLTAPILDEALLGEAEQAIINLKTDDLELKFELAFAIRNILSAEEVEALSECFDIDVVEPVTDEE